MHTVLFYVITCISLTTISEGFLCNENFHCNLRGNDGCCLIRAYTIIKDDDWTFFLYRNDAVERFLFEANQNIFFLPIKVSHSIPNVNTYIAKECAVLELNDENFSGLYKLKFLDLSSNKITSLKTSFFKDLLELEKIFLGEYGC